MLSRIFSRWLPCATLAAWSGILLYFFASGRLQAFLIPAFRPYVLVAGVIMGLMALVFALFPANTACCSTAECGHPLSSQNGGKILTFLVLLVPISVAALFSPDSFGKATMENRGVLTDASTLKPKTRSQPSAPPDSSLPTKDGTSPVPAAPAIGGGSGSKEPSPTDYLERTPEGYIVTEVLDLLYAAQDDQLRKDFEGQTVQLIGQLMPDKTNNGSGKRFKAVRMFMTCCAADARPVGALVETSALPELPEMTWVKVVGKSTFPFENGRRISVLQAEKVEKTDPPQETMLY